ncbi:hypothetical protein CPC08DRAFT_756458 [Agrocybe pediades]|nr:hypothetical protein CPC08DRAFT_756458 [Agrocybe pediades]
MVERYGRGRNGAGIIVFEPCSSRGLRLQQNQKPNIKSVQGEAEDEDDDKGIPKKRKEGKKKKLTWLVPYPTSFPLFGSFDRGNTPNITTESISNDNDDDNGFLFQWLGGGGVVELKLDKVVGRTRGDLETRVLQE